MKLRRATILDGATLRHWDKRPHVIAASGNGGGYDWEAELPRQVAWRQLLIAEDEGRPIGLLQIIDPAEEESHYWGKIAPNLRAIDIWIGEESHLGRRFGSAMMRLAVDRCFSNPCVAAVLIDPLESNSRARRFYERLGFRRVERRRFGPDDCIIYRLDRDDWWSCTARE